MTIYLAGGCFWGVEAYFSSLKGVLETEVGYANSRVEKPSYELVCTGTTDAAEAMRLVFDETVLSLSKVLEHFFTIIDPYTLNRQAHDIGTQYRTGIYTLDENTLAVIINWMKDYFKASFSHVKTEVMVLENYYPAEDYHQHYLDKNPNGYCHIDLSKRLKEDLK